MIVWVTHGDHVLLYLKVLVCTATDVYTFPVGGEHIEL